MARAGRRAKSFTLSGSCAMASSARVLQGKHDSAWSAPPCKVMQSHAKPDAVGGGA